MGEAASDRSAMTVPRFVAAKAEGRRLVMLTAYDALWSGLFDQAGVDALLVGDSLSMVVQGHDTTLPVTLDEVIYHTRLVARGVRRSLVVGDMPFGSYHVSPEQGVESAIRLVKEGGAHCVKLEGGAHMAETIERITLAQIPVMAHVGLTPQSVNQMGGFRVQGRGEEGRAQVMRDALAVQEAGAFSVVLEGIPAEVAEEVTQALEIPTIGIGAGPACDGQGLVMHDMLGLNDDSPSFVKQYVNLGSLAAQAARQFADEVGNRKFPEERHCYR